MARKLLYVRWLDHHTFHENQWRFPDEFDDVMPETVESVGWLINETKDVLVIAAHASTVEGGSVTGEMCILKKCVVKRKPIKIKE